MLAPVAAAALLCVLVLVAVVLYLRRAGRRGSRNGAVRELSAGRVDPRESELERSIQAVRRILLELADAITGAHRATGESNSTLTMAREQVSGIEAAPELLDAKQLLLQEIDRVTRANSRLQVELANSRQALAEQRRELEQLRTAVRIDSLTGLGNRAHLEERLQEALEKLKRHQERFSLLMIDLDHFKRVNDRYGHRAGDRVLAGFAEQLRLKTRSTDFKARYGGEEFAVITHRADERMAASMARSLCAEIAQQSFRLPEHGDERLRVTISIGVAGARESDSMSTLIERADRALYRAKESGRNRVCEAGGEQESEGGEGEAGGGCRGEPGPSAAR